MNSKNYNTISNTTPIIALASIGKLNLLHEIFEKIIICESVRKEIEFGGKIYIPSVNTLEWITVNTDITINNQNLILDLDEGEKQTILIAIEMFNPNECLLLIDERKGRRIAESFGLKIKGTLGILAEAKRKNLIDNFKKYAMELLSNHLYYDPKLIDAISREVDV